MTDVRIADTKTRAKMNYLAVSVSRITRISGKKHHNGFTPRNVMKNFLTDAPNVICHQEATGIGIALIVGVICMGI